MWLVYRKTSIKEIELKNHFKKAYVKKNNGIVSF